MSTAMNKRVPQKRGISELADEPLVSREGLRYMGSDICCVVCVFIYSSWYYKINYSQDETYNMYLRVRYISILCPT